MAEQKAEVVKAKPKVDEPTVYVGDKKISAYILAGSIQLNNNQEILIKARGKNISRAVDVGELLKKNFSPNLEIVSINSGTETFEIEGRTKGVSSICVRLRKK